MCTSVTSELLLLIQLPALSIVELQETLYSSYIGKSFDTYLDQNFATTWGDSGIYHASISTCAPGNKQDWRIATARETVWFYCFESEYVFIDQDNTTLRTGSHHHVFHNHLNTGSPVVILEQRSGKIEIILQYEGAIPKDVPALWLKKAQL